MQQMLQVQYHIYFDIFQQFDNVKIILNSWAKQNRLQAEFGPGTVVCQALHDT